jgi:hypothetical protein
MHFNCPELLFFKGMMGALAPFSYLVSDKFDLFWARSRLLYNTNMRLFSHLNASLINCAPCLLESNQHSEGPVLLNILQPLLIL